VRVESKPQFDYELPEMIQDFDNHPSIVMWIPFNERWANF